MNRTVTALALLLLLVVLGSYTSALTTTSYSAYNTDAEGVSRFYERLDPEVLDQQTPEEQRGLAVMHGPLERLDPAADSLMILAPQTAYSDTEVERLEAYLVSGGRAMIVDEDQAGRHLVARLSRGVAITAAPVYSTSYTEDPLRPLVEDTGVIPGLPGTLELPATHAVEGEGTAVLRTHELSWLDEDHDGRPGLGEPQGPFALARLVEIGEGELLVAAFPALFQNAQGAALDPAKGEARDAIMAWLVDGDRRLVVHEGNRGNPDPLQVQTALSQSPGMVHYVVVLTVALAVVLTAFSVQLVRVRPPRRAPAEHKTADEATRRALSELSYR